MIKIIFKTLGAKDVDWNKYDFHITSVLTYSYKKSLRGNAKCLALEWGHWACYVALLQMDLD
jgi:hypothetical protein